MQAPVPHDPPKACGLAVTSLVCGCLGFLLAFLTGIPAIITGHMALGKIKRSGGTIGGTGIATTGLVLGYVTTAMTLVWIMVAALVTPAIFKALERAEMAENVSNVRQLHLGCLSYAMDHDGKYPPTLEALESEGFIMSLDALRYKDGKTKHDWIYSAGHMDTDDMSIILIAAPMTTGSGARPKRIALLLDGSARPMPESDYQQQLRDQQAAESAPGP